MVSKPSTLVLCLGVWLLLAWSAQRGFQGHDRGNQWSPALYLPEPDLIPITFLGFGDLVPDVLWLMIANQVGAHVDENRETLDRRIAWRRAVVHSLDMATAIDPDWRTVFYNGGPLLGMLELEDASILLNMRAMEHNPGDWYFPFQIAMSYSELGNETRAQEYMTQAAVSAQKDPNTPDYLTGLAATFGLAEGRGGMALALLDEQLDGIEFPEVRRQLQAKRVEVQLCLGRGMLRAALDDSLLWQNRAILDPQKLQASGLLAKLPQCPLGGSWYWDSALETFHCEGFDESFRAYQLNLGIAADKVRDQARCPQ